MHALLTLCLVLSSQLLAQQSLTIPSGFDATDAPARLWLPGVSKNFRQQLVVDAGHLQSMAGRTITAISWRRDSSNETFQGGSAHLLVRMAEATSDALHASPFFATNLGPNPTVVLNQTITLPNAPPQPTTGLTWNAANTARLLLATPFPYSGGNGIVIDIIGTTQSTGVAWWPADAAWDSSTGSVTNFGQGCGAFVDSNGHWAGAEARSLVPGGTAHFWARGSQGGLGFLLLDLIPPTVPGIPLALLVPGAGQNCSAYMLTSGSLLLETFDGQPRQGIGALAEHRLPLPATSWILGAQLHTQWFDLAQTATSNATTCTIAASMPTLGMATLQATASDATADVRQHIAHVLHFEFQ